jgi:hypothetical protein
MELPADMQFHEDIGLLIHRPHGVLNEAMVDKVISVIGELEAKQTKPFNRFWDTVEADEVDLNYRYVIHISLYRRLATTGRPPVKSAVLATDATIIHYAQVHAVMTQGSAISVRVFQDRGRAAKWLGVPMERLQRLDKGKEVR